MGKEKRPKFTWRISGNVVVENAFEYEAAHHEAPS